MHVQDAFDLLPFPAAASLASRSGRSRNREPLPLSPQRAAANHLPQNALEGRLLPGMQRREPQDLLDAEGTGRVPKQLCQSFWLKERHPAKASRLHSQTQLEGFGNLRGRKRLGEKEVDFENPGVAWGEEKFARAWTGLGGLIVGFAQPHALGHGR